MVLLLAFTRGYHRITHPKRSLEEKGSSMSRLAKVTAVLLALGALGLSFPLVDVAWAQPGSTPVRVINPATAPALTRDVDNPATRPFSKQLCLTDIAGACITNTGQTVKQLVIEFVSGLCVGTGRSTFVEIANRPVGGFATSDAGDNYSTNRFPLAVAQFLQAPGVNGAQAFAQAARIYLNPGNTVSMSFDFVASGVLVCRAELNGHFVVN